MTQGSAPCTVASAGCLPHGSSLATTSRGWAPLTEDEVTYMTLHVVRMVEDLRLR